MDTDEELIKKAENDILDIISELDKTISNHIYDIYLHITPYVKLEDRNITNVNIELLEE